MNNREKMGGRCAVWWVGDLQNGKSWWEMYSMVIPGWEIRCMVIPGWEMYSIVIIGWGMCIMVYIWVRYAVW